jgi:hypothetical protein
MAEVDEWLGAGPGAGGLADRRASLPMTMMVDRYAAQGMHSYPPSCGGGHLAVCGTGQRKTVDI